MEGEELEEEFSSSVEPSIKHLCGDVEWAIVYETDVHEKGHGLRYKFVSHMNITEIKTMKQD